MYIQIIINNEDMKFKNKQITDPYLLAQAQAQAEEEQRQIALEQGVIKLLDFISPPSLEFFTSHYTLGTQYLRSAYIYGYPREVYTGWMSNLVGLADVMDLALHIYPTSSDVALKGLRRKVTNLEASMSLDAEHGKIRDPQKEAELLDAEEIREKLQVGQEKLFKFGFYYTMYGRDMEEMETAHKRLESILAQQLIYSKPAAGQQEGALNSIAPLGFDQMAIGRSMNTGALSTTFPFTSADLTQEDGILYGINLHNSGLVIFDRFSLENSNSVVLSESGGGKSFAVKLEALRLMMLGVEVLVIDPENEYQRMTEAIGGAYINLSLNSPTRINPFDLPKALEGDDEDPLRNNLIHLHGLLKLMLGGMNTHSTGGLSPLEESELDSALIETYAKMGITSDPLTHSSQPPTIKDLYDTLAHMSEIGQKLAQQLKKYVTGTFAGIFSEQSNLNINNQLVVFNIRDLEDELRPVAMYVALNFIWNKAKSDHKRRILIVDEAWQIMKYEDSAHFMFGLTKRARKYNLGITNITQDVEDFTASRLGRSIIANSSIQILLKQSSSAIDLLSDIFKLTSNEKRMLNQFPIGQGLFFAGRNHVQIQVIASPTEKGLITTNPDELAELKK